MLLDFEEDINDKKELEFGTSIADNFRSSEGLIRHISEIFSFEKSPFEKRTVIWDMFYFDGKVIDYWKNQKLVCINERADAYDSSSIPEKFDVIISVPCFEKKELTKAFTRAFEIHEDTKVPFAFIAPTSFASTKVFIDKYRDFTKCRKIDPKEPIIIFENIYGDMITK